MSRFASLHAGSAVIIVANILPRPFFTAVWSIVPRKTYFFYEVLTVNQKCYDLLYIGYHAFSETALTSVKLPSKLKEAVASFEDCTSFEKAEFAAGATIVPCGSYQSYSHGIFENCSALKEVVLPEGIEVINYYAFYGCSSLAEIKLPSTVKSMRESAFNGATLLKEIGLPEGLTELGYMAFAGTSISSVKIPSRIYRFNYKSKHKYIAY